METRKAFRKMLKSAKEIPGTSAQSIRNAKAGVEVGTFPSDKLMRKWLKKAGWRLKQSEEWEEVL